MQGSVDIRNTLGALLIGSFAAAAFSGVVSVQTFVYLKLYPGDRLGIKLMALTVWLLDMCHTIFVCRTVWWLLITHFGVHSKINVLPWSLALTIIFTAILTILVHFFFVYRVHKLSNENFYISIPLALLALSRLGFACMATVQMITLRLLSEFVKKYTWTFTTDLGISSVMDVLITVCLCYLLKRKQRRHPSRMDRVLDLLMLYAFETGALTCIATLIALTCWLAMPTNLIFMGLHFVIIKFYANSLLATLNTRKQLQMTDIDSMPEIEPQQREHQHMSETASSETRCSATDVKHVSLEMQV
ncbi:hypothetical protein AX17_002041 [Amanita inopinata Kibby_2008]|nr:hypothetical protein AX17_002041 [Amanita inopinata Kibby_2008]